MAKSSLDWNDVGQVKHYADRLFKKTKIQQSVIRFVGMKVEYIICPTDKEDKYLSDSRCTLVYQTGVFKR